MKPVTEGHILGLVFLFSEDISASQIMRLFEHMDYDSKQAAAHIRRMLDEGTIKASNGFNLMVGEIE